MKTHSLLRFCSIVIPSLHLAIIFGLLYSPGNNGNLWQWAWSNLLVSVFLLGALVFPPQASWVAFKLPTRMISLVNLWISLPLTLVACVFFGFFWIDSLLPYTYACGNSWNVCSGLNSLLTSLPFGILFFGFGLSSLLCFMLAIRLTLLRTHEQAGLHVRQPDALVSIEEASGERSSISEEEMRPSRVVQDFRLLLLAFLGFLCHLLIAVSLFFPYVDSYGANIPLTFTTGWQLLAQAFQPQVSPGVVNMSLLPVLPAPLALVLLSTMILPALIYLICMAFWTVESRQKGMVLRKSLSACFLLNLLGLSLSSLYVVLSVFSHGGDLHNPVLNTHLAFAIPPFAFLLSLACSHMLVKHFRLRSGPVA